MSAITPAPSTATTAALPQITAAPTTPLTLSVENNAEISKALTQALNQASNADVIALKLIALTSKNQLLTLLNNMPLTLNIGSNQLPKYVQDLIAKLSDNPNTPVTLLMKVVSNGSGGMPQLAFLDQKSANLLNTQSIASGVVVNSAQEMMNPQNKVPSSPLSQSSPLNIMIAQATLNAASTQKGLAPLLLNLQQINEAIVSEPKHIIKQSLQPLLNQTSALIMNSEKPINASQIRTLMQLSGLFYEANFQNTNPQQTDLKGLLTQVRDALVQFKTQIPQAQVSSEISTFEKSTNHSDLKTPAPPLKHGALPVEQAVKAALPPELPLTQLVERLISQAQGALKRITLMQIASLPETANPEQPKLSYEQTPRTYMFEIPLRTPEGMASLGFKVQGPIKEDQKNAAAEKIRDIWQVKFGVNLEPLGAIEAHIQIKTVHASFAKISVDLWAERIDVARSFQSSRMDLRDVLTKADFDVEELHVHVGKPVVTPAQNSSHVVDMHL